MYTLASAILHGHVAYGFHGAPWPGEKGRKQKVSPRVHRVGTM